MSNSDGDAFRVSAGCEGLKRTMTNWQYLNTHKHTHLSNLSQHDTTRQTIHRSLYTATVDLIHCVKRQPCATGKRLCSKGKRKGKGSV